MYELSYEYILKSYYIPDILVRRDPNWSNLTFAIQTWTIWISLMICEYMTQNPLEINCGPSENLLFHHPWCLNQMVNIL